MALRHFINFVLLLLLTLLLLLEAILVGEFKKTAQQWAPYHFRALQSRCLLPHIRCVVMNWNWTGLWPQLMAA